MKKKIFLVTAFLIIMLFGCDKNKNVDYGEITNSEFGENTNSGDDNLSEENVVGLKATLGIDADILKDEIKLDDTTIYIEAEIDLPETDRLYTMKVKEKYLTDDDKKRIVEYFVSPETVRVDEKRQLTKERYYKYISNSDDISDKQLEYMQKYMESLPESVENIELDYGLQAFSGFNKDVEYSFYFYSKKEVKCSGFEVRRYCDYDDIKIPENTEENTISEEEAVYRAKKVLDELDITGLDVAAVEVNTVEKVVEEAGKDRKITWSDGYKLVFTRCINGICVNKDEYWEYIPKQDFDSIVYPKEIVSITIDKNGVSYLFVQGLMEEISMGTSVKLLDINKIKEIIDREVVTKADGINDRWETLSLVYDRVDGENKGEYCYLPVWRFAKEKNSNISLDLIYMNAIDGNIIEPIYKTNYWNFYR